MDLTKVVFPLVSPEPAKDICEIEGINEGLGILHVFLISHGVLVEAWQPAHLDQSEDWRGQNSDFSAFYIGALAPFN